MCAIHIFALAYIRHLPPQPPMEEGLTTEGQGNLNIIRGNVVSTKTHTHTHIFSAPPERFFILIFVLKNFSEALTRR